MLKFSQVMLEIGLTLKTLTLTPTPTLTPTLTLTPTPSLPLTRYIVPLFLYVDCNHSGKKPGYLLRSLGMQEADPDAAAALSRFASSSAVAA